MKRCLWLLLLIVGTPTLAYGQGVRHDDISLHNVAGFAKIVPNATVKVCTSAATGVPCTPAATIYTDITLSTPLSTSPFTTGDVNGNYHFFAHAGTYVVTISGPGVTGTNYTVDLNDISANAAVLNASNTWVSDQFFKSGNPWYDVKAFGAKCDDPGNGTGTDDTAAFNSAISAAHTAFGGIVYVPHSSGICRVVGGSLSWPTNNGSWTYILFDNGLFISTSSITIAATKSKTAFYGRRGSAIGVSGSESGPEVNLITGGNFPAITLSGPLTGFYMHGIGLIENTGSNTACNFKIVSDGSGGGPTQMDLDYVMMTSATGTGGNICSVPTVAGDSTGQRLRLRNFFLQTPNSTVPAISMQNFNFLYAENGQINNGVVKVTCDGTYAQDQAGFSFKELVHESLTNAALFQLTGAGTCHVANVVIDDVKIADPIGNHYYIKATGSNTPQQVMILNHRSNSVTAYFDPASDALSTIGVIGLPNGCPDDAATLAIVAQCSLTVYEQAANTALRIGRGRFYVGPSPSLTAAKGIVHFGDPAGLSGASFAGFNPIVSILSDSVGGTSGVTIAGPNNGVGIYCFTRPSATCPGGLYYLHSTDDMRIYLNSNPSYSFKTTGTKLANFTQANSADRTYTWPDFNGIPAMSNAAQTWSGNQTNMVLVTPTLGVASATSVTASAGLSGATYSTATNCAVNSASPAACGSAAAGVFVVPTLTTTYTVNTTAVTTNSRIFLQVISDNTGIPSSPTCAAIAITSLSMQSARVAATSFTFTLPSTTGTTCFNYFIIN